MHTFFLILFVLSVIALFVALSNPAGIGLKSRRQVWIGVGGICLMFLSFYWTTAPSSPASADTASQVASTPQTDEEKIRAIVTKVYGDSTNMSPKKPELRNLQIVSQVNGGYGVFVEINANDNLTKNMTKGGIELDMSDFYIALFKSGIDVRAASVAAYMPTVDKYGNESDAIVYKSRLSKDEVNRVNWSADEYTLRRILPNVWDTSSLNYDFR